MNRDTVFFLIALSVTIFLFFSIKKSGDPATKITILKEEVDNRLFQDSLFITRLGADWSLDDLKKLSDGPFGIEVYQNNELVWWNDAARIIPKYKESRYIIHQSSNTVFVLRTELNEFKGHRFIPLQQIHTLDKEKNNPMFFRGMDYSVQYAPGWRIIGMIWLFFVSWLVCFIPFFRKTFSPKNIKKPYTTLAIWLMVSRLVFSWDEVRSVLEPILLFGGVSDHFIFLSPITLLIDAAIIWLAIFFLQSTAGHRFINQLSSSLLYFISAFALSCSFIYWNTIIKIAAISDGVFVDISDIILFDLSSILVIISLIFHLFGGFLILHTLFTKAHKRKIPGSKKYVMLLAGVLFSFPVFYTGMLQINPVLYYLFLVAVVLILDAYAEMKEQKLTYLLWWMLLFCGYMAVSFFHYDNLRSTIQREKFAEATFSSSSIEEVRTSKNIKQILDTSAIFLKLGTLEFPAKWDKEEIKDLYASLIRIDPGFFDIELFDDNGFSLFTNHFGNYHQIKRSLQIAELVEGNNLFYQPLVNSYFLRYEILPQNHPDGPWLFVLTFKTDSVPKEVMGGLSYALLKQGFIADKKYESEEVPGDQELIHIQKGGVHGKFMYTVKENDMGYKLIIFEPKPGLLKPISIFSFLFALTGGLLIFLTWVNTKKQILPENLPLKLGTRSSLKTKIQLSIILLIIFSFIVVGAVTAFYFYNLIQANQSGKEREETQILANSVVQESRDKDDDKEIISYFYKNLLNLSYVHGKNLQLYDNQGRLLATSTKIPVEYIMPFQESNQFKVGLTKKWVQKGNHHFDYIPLINALGKNVGYLGIQHQYSDISSKSIVDFLGTILNVYIFLFLIAGVIAITIANSITQPIAILAEKLKKFKLGKSNEYLEWQSHDEVGELIKQYNNLSDELIRSAEQLAKNERDMAWREMAKQVAHEIKNPLTPMKLSIQYLEKTSKEDPDRAQGMISRVSSTLIEQIDNLSQIAVEFSNFATMPQASNEKVVLNDLVVTIHDLFRKRDDMDITLSTPIDDLIVFADKNHLVRILNNLVKNAIQAIPDGKRGKIDISLYRESNNAVIRVSDNGVGIPESMKTKVFAPNFTTKSSGTGLGLAISANMIESFNGKIYFESEDQMGTRFFISIPMMKNEDLSDVNRVNLDE